MDRMLGQSIHSGEVARPRARELSDKIIFQADHDLTTASEVSRRSRPSKKCLQAPVDYPEDILATDDG